jgi:anti-sigma factor ChrR (cupin superfamily)
MNADSAPALNGDLAQPVSVDGSALEWTPSPGGEVLRKRLHRVGPAESGQVTSIVRYQPGSEFPSHAHPQGEEILVLEGVFSDEHGDWPAGTTCSTPRASNIDPSHARAACCS